MSATVIPVDRIERAIYLIRGQKVMLDRDLAALCGVEARALKQAVKRNEARFPSDFMFVLSDDELSKWRSQFVTSSADRMLPHKSFRGIYWESRAKCRSSV